MSEKYSLAIKIFTLPRMETYYENLLLYKKRYSNIEDFYRYLEVIDVFYIYLERNR